MVAEASSRDYEHTSVWTKTGTLLLVQLWEGTLLYEQCFISASRFEAILFVFTSPTNNMTTNHPNEDRTAQLQRRPIAAGILEQSVILYY